MKLDIILADWCEPCKLQMKEFNNHPIGIEVHEIWCNSKDYKSVVSKYGIVEIPYMLLYNDEGVVIDEFKGYTTSDVILDSIKQFKEKNLGRFIVIEDFNGSITIVTNPESGDTLVFDTYNEALAESKKCQNGKIVKL